MRERPTNALGLDEAWSYSYTRTDGSGPASVAVRLNLTNTGAEPWTLAGAALVDSTGEEVELARWQDAPIPANGAGAVVKWCCPPLSDSVLRDAIWSAGEQRMEECGFRRF